MKSDQNNIVIDNFSLEYLFEQLKKSNDNYNMSRVYAKTHDHIFNYVYPKISSEKDALIIVQNVYRQLSKTNLENEKEISLLSYLERLADGLLIICVEDSNQSKQIKKELVI